MAKKNKQREKQDQSRASSSARAHQTLLSSAGAGAPPAFIGFASFAQPAPHAVQATPKAAALYTKPVVQSIYDGADHEIALALKMLAKKGAVTKIKALQSFLTDVLPPRQPQELRPMLGHWTQLYAFEMRDQNDRKVRQLLNEVLLALAGKMRPRAFLPHLQRLLPYWFLAMHDVNADVAVLAKKAFETLLPELEMRSSVVEEHLAAMMEEYRVFFTKTPDTFEGIPLQPDEKEERYERCISAAILSIDAVVKTFAEQGMTDKLIDEESNCSVASVVTSDKFTKLAAASSKHPNFTRDIVRRSMYVALLTLITKARSIISAREEAFGKVVLGMIGDKSPANHEAMWNAVLTFLQAFPNVWNSSPSFPKFVISAVYPRLFAQIRHGFYGSGRSSFPTLLPLLSMVPLSVAVDPIKGQSTLYAGVLEQCWKFIESKDARFCEPPAITAYFECLTGSLSIFLKTYASTEQISEQDAEILKTNYVNQFEKVFVSSITIALSLPEFPDSQVKFFSDSLLKTIDRLSNFPSDLALINDLKEDFLVKVHEWIRQTFSEMISKMVFLPTRMNTFMDTGLHPDCKKEHELEQWRLCGKTIYRQSLAKIDTLMLDSEFSQEKNGFLSQLLEVIGGICKVLPLDAVLLDDEKPVEAHFDIHYRPVLNALALWKKSESKEVAKTMYVALELTRPFFLAAHEKKQFLLQLFRDCNVQFGDMAEASDVIRYGLQFPITAEGNKLWLSCGSWQKQYDSGAVEGDISISTLDALQAIWQGKLLDEFLMISLKGRLDDLDSEAFATLLGACLGGLAHFPVVSSDAVVILCHFVIQNGPESSDAVVMQILPHLCELFFKLNGDLPAELEAVEGQLYKLLFQLSAQGSFRSEATALWERTVRHSLKSWSSNRAEPFVNELADYVNSFLLADLPTGTISFNSKKFAAYVKSFLHLAKDQTYLTTSQLVEKLDAVHLRCREKDEQLFYSRVLLGLGDVCENEDVVDILKTYFVDVVSKDEQKAIDLVTKLVDVDATSALTWVVFHSDDHVQKDTGVIDVMESYLTLDHLYEALKPSSSILDMVLLNVLSTDRNKNERTNAVHRNLVFLNKNQGAVLVEDTLLTPQQHDKLDELIIAILSNYSTVEVRKEVVDKLIDGSETCKNVAAQFVATSLVASLHNEQQKADGVVSTLHKFFTAGDSNAATASTVEFFAYLRLITKLLIEARSSTGIFVGNFVDLSAQESVLSRVEAIMAPGSSTVVEVSEWTSAAEYVSSLSVHLKDVTTDFQKLWESAARSLVMHAIAGKSETAKVTALKMQKRSVAFVNRANIKGDEEQIVLAYSEELVAARAAMLTLVSTIHTTNADALQELAAHYREALLATVLCAFSESAQLKTGAVAAYVASVSPAQCYDLINLWFGIEKTFAHMLAALRSTITAINDVDQIKRLVLESFGGIETLASLFNENRYPLPPILRVLLYILASYSGALRSLTYDTSAIDVNAENESATEAALAKVLIPRALRSALRAVFGDKKGKHGARNIRMRSRKQKVQEREDIVGKLLLWDLFLQLFPTNGNGSEANPTSDGPSSSMIASSLSSYVARHKIFTNFLGFTAALLSQEPQIAGKAALKELQDAPAFEIEDLEKSEDDEVWSFHKARVFQLGTHVFFRTVVRLPAMVRSWWNDDCSRATRSWAAKYFEDHITPSVLAAELMLIQKASEAGLGSGDQSFEDEEITVKGSRVSREITTTYVKDECALEMVVRVPSSYPLRSVEVECTKRIGISEDRWRRWVLQIIRVTAARDGSLLDAVMLWKRNVDQEFEGVEPCPICYSILNPKNMGLPSLPCKTCNNKYHNSCLYKWFNQSGKNKCPICQQPFC